MSLITGALISVAELLRHLGKSEADILKPFFNIYNSSGDATSATITKTGNTLNLTVVGGVNVMNVNYTLTDADKDTITELVTYINVTVGKGWVANAGYGGGGQASTNLWNIGAIPCLLIANEIEVEGKDYEYYEDLINSATHQIQNFCSKVFLTTGSDETFYLDSNSNRVLFLDKYPIISITSVDLWDPALSPPASRYTMIEYTNYIKKSAEGILYTKGGWGLGFDQVRVIGQFGYTAANLPDDLKRACAELCAFNMGRADKSGLKAEKIGSYSYTKEDIGESGIPNEIREKLMPYIKQGRNIG